MPVSSARQEALGHQLGVACKTGHLDKVQRLLAAGAAKEIPTLVMGMMMTPLNAAAYTNNVRSKSNLVCWRSACVDVGCSSQVAARARETELLKF